MGQKVILITSEQIENVTWTTQAWSKWKEMPETTQTVTRREKRETEKAWTNSDFIFDPHLSIRRKPNSKNRKKSSTVTSLYEFN